jgi:hypothetical protein
MRADPQFAAVGGTFEAYSTHILNSCAFAIVKPGDVSNSAVAEGTCDRYGGAAIGSNGGSGRAAFINGYHVKGIGRTPLVSYLTSDGHASGGAYLEECVRETIFAELVAAEFPGGAIPTLAIIETGDVQIWDTNEGPVPERRCLLVRPAFVRPAHFERAPLFQSGNPKEGTLDAARVRLAFESGIALWGRNTFLANYRSFWLKWAEQLAYGFVHRLPHGGTTVSNICLGGQLLDFGAMAALPSLSQAITAEGAPAAGRDFGVLSDAIRAQMLPLSRYLDPVFSTKRQLDLVLTTAAKRYQDVVVREMFRLAGLTSQNVKAIFSSRNFKAYRRAISRVLSYYQREQFTIFDGTPEPRLEWDFEKLWHDHPPSHLVELRQLLEPFLTSPTRLKHVSRVCSLRCRPRSELYRETLKAHIYESLEAKSQGTELPVDQVASFISTIVNRNRRDARDELNSASIVGFARNGSSSLALYRLESTRQLVALDEWQRSDPTEISDRDAWPVNSIGTDHIVFAGTSRKIFEGDVWIQSDMREINRQDTH